MLDCFNSSLQILTASIIVVIGSPMVVYLVNRFVFAQYLLDCFRRDFLAENFLNLLLIFVLFGLSDLALREERAVRVFIFRFFRDKPLTR